MIVRDIMKTQVLTASKGASLKDAARMMCENSIGGLPILNGGKIEGIVTERDIISFISHEEPKRIEKAKAGEIMTPYVITVRSSSGLESAARLMIDNRIKRLPVVDEGRLVGIITATDMITAQPDLTRYASDLFGKKEKRPYARPSRPSSKAKRKA